MSPADSDPVLGLIQLVGANRIEILRPVLECAEKEGKLFRFLESSALKISEKEPKLERTDPHPALKCAVRMGELDMVNELVSFYRKASKLDAFVRSDVLVPLFDTALVQKTWDIADRLLEIASELDTNAATDPETKLQLQQRLDEANWNQPENVERTVSNWIASETRILRHAFVWRLDGVVEHVIALTEKHPEISAALVDNFRTSISEQGVMMVERLSDNLSDCHQGLEKHTTGLLEFNTDLIARYAKLSEAPRSPKIVLKDAKNIVHLAKRAEQIYFISDNIAEDAVNYADELDNIDVSITIERGQPNDSALPADITCHYWFEYTRASESVGNSFANVQRILAAERAGNASGIVSQSTSSEGHPDINTLSPSPMAHPRLLESLLETFAGLRWQHHASAKSWLESFNRVFSNEKLAMDYVYAAFSTSPTEWSRTAMFLGYPYSFNLLELSSSDSMVIDNIFNRLVGLRVPNEQFPAAPWERFLVMEPQLVRLLPLAAKVNEYVTDSQTDYPAHLPGFKSLILETCLKGLGLNAHQLIADRLRDALKNSRGRTNSLTPEDKICSAYSIPIKGLDPNGLDYLDGLLELGLFGDASLAMGPTLFLVSGNDSHEKYLLAVECLKTLANDHTVSSKGDYYSFMRCDRTTTLAIQKQIALCFQNTQGSESSGGAVVDEEDVVGYESVTRGPIECAFKCWNMRNLLAHFSLGGRKETKSPQGLSWDAIAMFAKVCSSIIDKSRSAAMVNMAAEDAARAAAQLKRDSMTLDPVPSDAKRLT
jgi:hypothetical protein